MPILGYMDIMAEDNDYIDNIEIEEQVLRIPQNRIGVVIGKQGATKALIEEKAHIQLEIDSADGSVKIKPAKADDDPIHVWIARDIIKAIGRGFSEQKALKLLDPDFYLDIITLEHDTNRLRQIRGRVIGEGGRTRRIIEQSTMSHISVQGKTIAIIGYVDEVPIAKKVIELLIDGQRHSTVYKILEKHRIDRKKEETNIWQEKIALRDGIDSRDEFMMQFDPSPPGANHSEEDFDNNSTDDFDEDSDDKYDDSED